MTKTIRNLHINGRDELVLLFFAVVLTFSAVIVTLF